jgi:hypothetical protein
MRVFKFHVEVALPDDADESELLEQVRYFVAELSGDASVSPPRRGQAKAVLESITEAGADPLDAMAWNQSACATIAKQEPLDLFTDLRGRTERRRRP